MVWLCLVANLKTETMRKGNSKLLIRNLRKQADKKQLNIGVVSNSVCPKCGTKGYKTTLTENSYACKKCETWWANGC
jgi:tRNA(Ile2) C34 agmatinyltransferase TiaS|tara:strand:- start:1 stop:231 length:231 start_codon:yes stop_codon:yes gene_type:complete